MNRRSFLQSSSAIAGLSALHSLGLTGCSSKARMATGANATAPALPFYDAPGPIIPIRGDLDRIFRITVCLRPFAQPVRDSTLSALALDAPGPDDA
jgi:hypothetical protein